MRFFGLMALFLSSAAFCETVTETFEKVWSTSKSHIYDVQREKTFFTPEKYAELSKKAKEARTLEEFKGPLNAFFQTLNLSHTHFYTDTDIEYYVFRSLFVTRDIETPVLTHIGAMFKEFEGKMYVSALLEGFPAEKAGIQRGDVILSVDNKPLVPAKSFTFGKKNSVKVLRGQQLLQINVLPVQESMHLSLLKAMENSVRYITSKDGKRAGVVHLWSGTHPKILEAFQKIISEKMLKVDFLVLDLRDGFGGAWHEYLDPFFPNRDTFYQNTQIDRDGKRTITLPEKIPDHPYFKLPMAVLINEGTRSGKEALAFQFKKNGRAILVGTSTAGAFAGGQGYFLEEKSDHLLYLGIFELLLDNQKIEGLGVKPHFTVPWPFNKPNQKDFPLTRALNFLFFGR